MNPSEKAHSSKHVLLPKSSCPYVDSDSDSDMHCEDTNLSHPPDDNDESYCLSVNDPGLVTPGSVADTSAFDDDNNDLDKLNQPGKEEGNNLVLKLMLQQSSNQASGGGVGGGGATQQQTDQLLLKHPTGLGDNKQPTNANMHNKSSSSSGFIASLPPSDEDMDGEGGGNGNNYTLSMLTGPTVWEPLQFPQCQEMDEEMMRSGAAQVQEDKTMGKLSSSSALLSSFSLDEEVDSYNEMMATGEEDEDDDSDHHDVNQPARGPEDSDHDELTYKTLSHRDDAAVAAGLQETTGASNTTTPVAGATAAASADKAAQYDNTVLFSAQQLLTNSLSPRVKGLHCQQELEKCLKMHGREEQDLDQVSYNLLMSLLRMDVKQIDKMLTILRDLMKLRVMAVGECLDDLDLSTQQGGAVASASVSVSEDAHSQATSNWSVHHNPRPGDNPNRVARYFHLHEHDEFVTSFQNKGDRRIKALTLRSGCHMTLTKESNHASRITHRSSYCNYVLKVEGDNAEQVRRCCLMLQDTYRNIMLRNIN